MKKRHLEGLGKVNPPRGYSLRTYEDGDDAHWAGIVSRAFGWEVSPVIFRREIAEREAFRPDRVFFLVYRGEPIGTAITWSKPELGPRAGYVHMVAVLPEHTGKGLGKVLALAVLRQLKRLGFRSAFLQTDDEWLAAIKTYLELGFEPVIEEESVRRRWVEVFQGLKRPDLSHRYCREE
jgi:mycothiol synthase